MTPQHLARTLRARLVPDDRGASEILGLVFAFALVVSVVATAQLSMTPALTAGDEADHAHRVLADLAALDSAVFDAAGTDAAGRLAVETDVTYPERYLVVSPPDSTGTFATAAAGPVSLTGAVAVGQGAGYWNGNRKDFGTTQTLVYAPDYSERSDERLYIESGVSYLVGSDGGEVVHRQSLVRGHDVSVVLLDGELGGQTVSGQSVRVTPVATSDRAITVRSTDGDPLTVSVPTTLSESTWRALLADESTVRNVSYHPVPGGDHHVLTVELAPGLYDLHVARVLVGSPAPAGGAYAVAAAAPSPNDEVAYLVLESANGTWVPTGGRETIAVRAYDRFGSPVSGATVAWTDGSHGTVSAPDGVVTDESGRVSLRFLADDATIDDPEPDDVTVQVAGRDDTRVTVAFEIRAYGDSVDIGRV